MPVTVTVYTALGVAAVVEIVNVEEAVPFATGVMEEGVRLHVTVGSIGAIAQANPTGELKLFREVTVIVEVVEKAEPAIVVPEEGELPMLKSFTERVKVAVRLWPIEEPVTVTV